jgi:ketosteroid isomerase-like protein
MKLLLRTIVVSLVLGVFAVPSALAASAPAEKELMAIMKTLMDAIASGEKEPWQTHLADDFVLLDRDGTVKVKKDLVDGAAPIRPGYTLALEMVDVHSRDLGGNAVVLWYRVLEDMTIFGQPIHVEYRNSHVFQKRGGKWQMLTWHYVELLRDPDPLPVDAKAYEALVGEYALSDTVKFVVTLRDGKLYGARAGRPESERIPECEHVFGTAGSEFRKIFLRDPDGKVTAMVDRRKGSDTTWKKVK